MPETMKLFSEYYLFEIKPSFDMSKAAKKYSQDFMAFSVDFEKKVNDILKDGWTLVNTNFAIMGASVLMTATLKKQN